MEAGAAQEHVENRLVAPPRIRDCPSDLELQDEFQSWVGLSARPLAIQPVTMPENGGWIALLTSGDLLRLNPSHPTATIIANVINTGLTMRDDWGLHVSSDGEFIAVVETKGSRGMVFCTKTGEKTILLPRPDGRSGWE